MTIIRETALAHCCAQCGAPEYGCISKDVIFLCTDCLNQAIAQAYQETISVDAPIEITLQELMNLGLTDEEIAAISASSRQKED